MPEVIFDNDGYRIEFHKSSSEGKGLIFTFTPFMFSNINSDGFGVKFLLAEGYDVVSFKCVKDSWFQNLPLSAIEAAAAIGRSYNRVVTYGSSMGGFAAVAFADLLAATEIIAVCPQYTIKEAFDKRWSRQAAAISEWPFEIQEGSCKGCRITFLYDNFLRSDRSQVEKIIKAVGSSDIHEITVPFSGHPAGHFLSETGQMAEIVRSILNCENDIRVNYNWSRIRNSHRFIFRFGCYAAERERFGLALLCFFRAVALAPKQEQYWQRLIGLLSSMDRIQETLEHGGRTAVLLADNAEFRCRLSVMLSQVGRVEEAVVHARRAVELAPDNVDFQKSLAVIMNNAGSLRA